MENPKGYEPHEAAAMLGMSSANLRRLASIYERVYGELPRDVRRGRVWPQEAIDRLKQARDTVRAGKAHSVQAALVAERKGEDLSSGDDIPAPNTIAFLIAEIRALRRTIEDQNRLIIEQGRRLDALESSEAYEPSEPRRSVPRERGAPALSLVVVGAILSAVAWAYPFWPYNSLFLVYVPGGERFYQVIGGYAWDIFLWTLAFAILLGFGFWFGFKKHGALDWVYTSMVAIAVGVTSLCAILVLTLANFRGSIPALPAWMDDFGGPLTFSAYQWILRVTVFMVPSLLVISSAALGNALQRKIARDDPNWSPRKQTLWGFAGAITASIIGAVTLIYVSRRP